MGLFKPLWEHENPIKRAKGAEKCRDQEVLKRLASQDPSHAVRLAALPNITDDLFLIQYAMQTDDYELADCSLSNIRDHKILTSYLVSQPKPICSSCEKQLSSMEQLLLETVATQAKSTDARVRAIQYLNGGQTLMALMDSEDASVFAAAYHRAVQLGIQPNVMSRLRASKDQSEKEQLLDEITDQNQLAYLALHDELVIFPGKTFPIREAAIQRVAYDDLLFQIALESEYGPVAQAAVEKLSPDEGCYQHIVSKAKSLDARLAAMKLVQDEDFATKELFEKHGVELVAATKIHDQTILGKTLAKIGNNENKTKLTAALLANVTNDDVLLEFVRKNNCCKEYAIKRFVKPSLLLEELPQLMREFGDFLYFKLAVKEHLFQICTADDIQKIKGLLSDPVLSEIGLILLQKLEPTFPAGLAAGDIAALHDRKYCVDAVHLLKKSTSDWMRFCDEKTVDTLLECIQKGQDLSISSEIIKALYVAGAYRDRIDACGDYIVKRHFDVYSCGEPHDDSPSMTLRNSLK